MAKVYVCDACGQVIEHPHSQKIKEFCLEANCDMGMAFAKPVEKKKEIHLCPDCYKALYLIAGGEKMPEPPEPPTNQTIKIRYLSDEIDKIGRAHV